MATTIHTATARPVATSTDAQAIAQGITRNLRQAVNQAMADSASKRDARKREIIRERFGPIVANALAGDALDSACRKILEANTAAGQSQHTGAPDPSEYFRGM